MIYTFYSFKGGVGRSMALANVAECFYLRGLRVIIVDWDLEAPGLETFFFERKKEPANGPGTYSSTQDGVDLVQSRLGLIDLLTEYKRSYAALVPPLEPPTASWAPKAFQERINRELTQNIAVASRSYEEMLDRHLPTVSTYLYPLHPPEESRNNGITDPHRGGGLWLLPAGWRYKERFQAYAEAVQAFDWNGFYRSFRGKEFFDWFARKLREIADVILIDSRTGVTEMGGVCARQLADVVVSLCAPNTQNVDGVVKMVQSFRREETIKARDGRPVHTIVIPTRIDPQEVRDLDGFLARFQEAVSEEENAPEAFRQAGGHFWDLRIPYRAVYSYHERRVIGPGIKDLDPTRGLENAYRKLTTHLALLAAESDIIRQKFGDEINAQFPALLPKVVLAYTGDMKWKASEVRRSLGEAGIKLWPDVEVSVSTSGDPPSWKIALGQAIHLVVVASGGHDQTPLRDLVRFGRQAGRRVHVIAPSADWRPPVWLANADFFPDATSDLLIVLRSTRAGDRSPMMAPAVPGVFISRPEIQTRLKSLVLESVSPKGRRVFALCGLPGMGKSTTAAAICQDDEVIDAFPDGILWADLTDPAAALEALHTALTGETFSGTGAADRVSSLLRNRRFLLVLDNAGSLVDIRPLLEMSDRATYLVITRSVDVASTVAASVVSVGAMTPEEGSRLLVGPGVTEEITQSLGGNPLAITLAKSHLDYLLATQITLPEALGQLKEQVDRHGILAFDTTLGYDGDTVGGAERESRPGAASKDSSVAGSLQSALSQLSSWQRRRFQQLGLVSSGQPIAFDQLSAEWDRFGPEAGEPSPFARIERERLLQRFSAMNVISWDPRAQRATLHPMYRKLMEAQGLIGGTPRQIKTRHVSSSEDRERNPDVKLARAVLSGQSVPFEEMRQHAERLKGARYFDLARQLFGRLRRMPEAAERRVWLGQRHALCTYKDVNLPRAERWDRALSILNEVDALDSSRDQETLGLAGAIYKYKWFAEGQISDLVKSAGYYRRGYEFGVTGDQGYTGINAAFILDLLAHSEERQNREARVTSPVVQQRREEARSIRERIASQVPSLARQPGNAWLRNQWWFLVTIAEAFFGLGRYDEALFWLKEALAQEVVEWEFESTARQLAMLAWLQNGGAVPPEDSAATATLRSFVGSDAAVKSVITGRTGLALSGGGFRASLFHIGVLARLAELDLLRSVEVLSCISGGSIIGAHYYLAVRKLLQEKPDEDIGRDDYIDLVRKIEEDFLKGVQSNLRTHLFSNWWTNLKSILVPGYSRTERLGVLFERQFFSRIESREDWWLDDLKIIPKDCAGDFQPKLDNWRRKAKAPILILNATTLNTGHNWQFTTTWMGEPPASVCSKIDANDLLRRMYYWEAPKNFRQFSLGRAVAASACVPGLFDPVEMRGLYPSRRIQLVDGGVYDNQGIAGLLEEECSVFLVSDASGQMSSENNPGTGAIKELGRSANISMARVRQVEFNDLNARLRSSQIRGVMYLHLTKGLENDPVDWVGCEEPYDASEESRPATRRGPRTEYGILKVVQEKLAALRTDLDSFTDTEAFALMYSGYSMASLELKNAYKSLKTLNGSATNWRFLSVDKIVNRTKDFEEAHEDMLRLLSVGAKNVGKAWRLSWMLWLMALLAFAALIFNVFGTEFAAGGLGLELIFVVFYLLLVPYFLALPLLFVSLVLGATLRKSWSQFLTGILMITVGWVPALLHLHIIDPVFLLRGRVRNPEEEESTGRHLLRGWKPILAALLLVIAVIAPFWIEGRDFTELKRSAFQTTAKGDFQHAVVVWDRVLEKSPNDADARANRAWANRELKQYPQALEDYTRAIELRDSVDTRINRAWIRRQLGQYKEAMEDYEKAIKLGSKEAERELEYTRKLAGVPPGAKAQ